MLKQINRFALLTLAAVSILFTAHADDNLKKAWDAFNNNKRDEAITLFTAATKDNASKAEAYLGLSIVHWENEKNEEAFKDFQNFFNATPNPYPYMYALWTTGCINGGYTKKPKAALDFLNKLIADPKTNGTIRAMAHSMIGYHDEHISDLKKSIAEFDQLAALDHWQIAGTFDNTSGSGFNKTYGPIEKPGADAVFKNKVDAEVKWFSVTNFRHDRWFDFAYNFIIDNSVMYAQTFVNSPLDQDVIARTGCSGSEKVWVNDKLVISVSEERNCDMDIYSNNIHLNKGYNRILVQIGESEAGRANFMVRLTDGDANPVKGLTCAFGPQSYQKSSGEDVKSATADPSSGGLLPFFAEDYFEKDLKKNPDNFVDLIMLAQVYLRNEKVYEARKILKHAHDLAPVSTFIGERLIDAYSRDNNNTDLTREQESIKSKDPESLYALELLLDDATNKEDYDEAEKLLDKLHTLYGESEFYDLKHIGLIAKRKNYDELIKLGNELYKKYPDSYSCMSIKYSIELGGSSKDLRKGNVVLENYLKNNYSDDVLTALASNYLKLGNTSEGMKIYNQRVANYPYAIGDYDDLADLYFSARDYSSALKWQLKTNEMAPYIGNYYNKIGKIYEAMSEKSKAIDSYKKCIYYDPTNYDARERLRTMEGKKNLFDNFAKTDVYELYHKAPAATAYPEDNSIILLIDDQRVVYPEGPNVEHSEILVKIFNQSGIENWKEYNIGYNQYTQRLIVEKAEVIKKDGNKVQAETNDNGYCVFTSLEVGDAIHLSYKIENYVTGKLAEHFWDKFHLNFAYPCTEARYSLLVPKSKDFKYNVLNSDMKPVIKDIEDYKLYTWESKDMPGIKGEPYMPPLSDIGTVLEVSSIPDWTYISNWYSDISSAKAKSDYEIKEIVADLFKDKQNLSDLEKAKVIYDYIENNMSYSNVAFLHSAFTPQKASRTLNTKLGDCKDLSTLFVAMAKEVGLKASLILVNTRDNGDKDILLPSVSFNHCIARLDIADKIYIIELTDKKLSFGSLPAILKNAKALHIPRENDPAPNDLINLSSINRVSNSVIRTSDISFDNDDMRVKRKTIKTGSFAERVRNDFAEIGKEEQEKAMSRSISGDFKSTVKLENLDFKDLQSLADTVDYSYTFNVKNELEEVVGLKLFKIPWTESESSLDFVNLETRKYPFNVWEFNSTEGTHEEVNIEIPKGKTLAEVPKSISLSCPAVDYNMTYKVANGKLTAIRDVKIKKDVVSTDEYAQFKDFYNKVLEEDTKQIGFKAGAAGAK